MDRLRSTDGDHPGQFGETPSLLKIQKISWAWCRVALVPATREDETGELLEPRRQNLQWSQDPATALLSEQQSETPSQKQNKTKQKKPKQKTKTLQEQKITD